MDGRSEIKKEIERYAIPRVSDVKDTISYRLDEQKTMHKKL